MRRGRGDVLLMALGLRDIATIRTMHFWGWAEPSGIPGDRGRVPNWWRGGQGGHRGAV